MFSKHKSSDASHKDMVTYEGLPAILSALRIDSGDEHLRSFIKERKESGKDFNLSFFLSLTRLWALRRAFQFLDTDSDQSLSMAEIFEHTPPSIPKICKKLLSLDLNVELDAIRLSDIVTGNDKEKWGANLSFSDFKALIDRLPTINSRIESWAQSLR